MNALPYLKRLFLFSVFSFLLTIQNAAAQTDSLMVKVNKTLYQRGETISIDCEMPYAGQMHMQASTLNVWIEDINKYKQWRYRYPFVNGRVSIDIVVDTAILDGKYALNFVVENQLFSMKGKVSDFVKKHNTITYLMLAKNAGNVVDQVKVADDGTFLMKNLIFEDTARFIFSPDGSAKDNENNLNIFIETPLDSAFTPVFTTTKFIVVGNGAMTTDNTAIGPIKSFKDYKFSPADFDENDKNILQEVVVKGKKKTKVEEFADRYVSGLFSGGDAKIFDGIEGTEIASSASIFTFLQGKVAGLQITSDNQGGYSLTWRGSATDIYLDEFRLTNTNDVYISPADVAMIKVFPPPAFLGGGGSGAGGAIAIYTKKGIYDKENKHKYNFLVRGYNPLETKWKLY